MPIPESLSSESESAKSLFKFSRLLLSGVAEDSDNSVFSEELVADVEVPESIEFFFRLLISMPPTTNRLSFTANEAWHSSGLGDWRSFSSKT